VALFGNGGVRMTSRAFVEFSGLLKAGHATQPPCYPVVRSRIVVIAARVE